MNSNPFSLHHVFTASAPMNFITSSYVLSLFANAFKRFSFPVSNYNDVFPDYILRMKSAFFLVSIIATSNISVLSRKMYDATRLQVIPVTTLSYMLRTWPETIARLISGLCVELLDFSFQLNNHMCAGPPCRFIPLISLRLSAAFCIFPEAANLQERGCMYKAGWLFM